MLTLQTRFPNLMINLGNVGLELWSTPKSTLQDDKK
jgi:hypothetical protein